MSLTLESTLRPVGRLSVPSTAAAQLVSARRSVTKCPQPDSAGSQSAGGLVDPRQPSQASPALSCSSGIPDHSDLHPRRTSPWS